MSTKSVPFINHSLRKPVPSHFFPKFLKLESIIYGSNLAADSKNFAQIPYVIAPIAPEYYYHIPPLNLRL